MASFRLQTLRTRGRESDIVVDYTYIHSHTVLQCIIYNSVCIYIYIHILEYIQQQWGRIRPKMQAAVEHARFPESTEARQQLEMKLRDSWQWVEAKNEA